jgi:hypothetical protein
VQSLRGLRIPAPPPTELPSLVPSRRPTYRGLVSVWPWLVCVGMHSGSPSRPFPLSPSVDAYSESSPLRLDPSQSQLRGFRPDPLSAFRLLPFRVALLVKNGAAAAAKLSLAARQQRLPPANAGFRECLQRGFDSRRLHFPRPSGSYAARRRTTMGPPMGRLGAAGR